MPNIIVNVMEGITPEQKNNVVKRITESASKDVGVPPCDVRIIITEHQAQNVAIGGEFLDKGSNAFNPLVFVNTIAGKTDEMLNNIRLHITEAMAETFKYPEDKIRVYFIERKIL
jgi:4-oxalocrotonate tautomerase family enzyme